MTCLIISIAAIIIAIGAAAIFYATANLTTKATMDLLAKQSDDKLLDAVRKWRAKR